MRNLGNPSVNGSEMFQVWTMIDNRLEGGVGASMAIFARNVRWVVAVLLNDCFDAIVGDLIAITNVECFQLCALGGDVLDCGIGDVGTARDHKVLQFISAEVFVDDIDHVIVLQLFFVIFAQKR